MMRLLRNTKAVGIVEYLVLVGFVGVVIVGSVFGAGGTLRDTFLAFSESFEATEVAGYGTGELGDGTLSSGSGDGVLSGGSDFVPDPFSFVPLSGEPLDILVSSDAVILTGFDGGIPVSVSGDGAPELSIEGGPWLTTGIISPGESLRVRLTTAPTNDTTRLVTIDAGGVSDVWAVRTEADLVPDPFSFADLSDQPTNALTLSNSIMLSGFSAPVDISVSGDGNPQISVNGGEWSETDVVSPGDEVRVRLTSSSSNDTTFSASIMVGGVSDVWSVETISDIIPDAFVFTDLLDQPLDTMTVSESLTLTGFTAPTPVSVSGDGTPQISVNGGPWITNGTLAPGQSLQVRLTSSSMNDATSVASVVVGGVVSDWSVSTLQAPSGPSPSDPSMVMTNYTPRSVSFGAADPNAFVRTDVNNMVALGRISNDPDSFTDQKIVFVESWTPGMVICSRCYYLTESQFPLISPSWLLSSFMTLRVTDWQPATNGAVYWAADSIQYGTSVSNQQSHYICAWSGSDCLSGSLVDLFSLDHSRRAAEAFCEAFGEDEYVTHTVAYTPSDFSPNSGPLPMGGFLFRNGTQWTERGAMNLPAGVPLMDTVTCASFP